MGAEVTKSWPSHELVVHLVQLLLNEWVAIYSSFLSPSARQRLVRLTPKPQSGLSMARLEADRELSVSLVEDREKNPVNDQVHSRLTVADLAPVIYSAGRVFNGLSTGREGTEQFLRSGSLAGLNSQSALALLEDLRDVA